MVLHLSHTPGSLAAFKVSAAHNPEVGAPPARAPPLGDIHALHGLLQRGTGPHLLNAFCQRKGSKSPTRRAGLPPANSRTLR